VTTTEQDQDVVELLLAQHNQIKTLFDEVPATQGDRKRELFEDLVRVAEATAPTRPHPHAGESAAANLVAGPPLAVFDRVRDKARDWRQSHSDGA
jgi:hypothetical protein